LLAVAHSYWSLVQARGQFTLQLRSAELAEDVATEIRDRVHIDVRPSQLNRVRTEVTNRRAAAVEARYAILRAQERLLRDVFGAGYVAYSDYEVVTVTVPSRSCQPIELDDKVQAGLRGRPEVHQAIRRIRAASVEEQIAKNDILPVLNIVLTGYVAGLRGNAAIGSAFADQFREGEPGVGTGLSFEYPLGNRAGKAALRQRQLTVARFRNELLTVTGRVTLEVRDQGTEVNKYVEVLDMKQDALSLAVADLENLTTRKQFLVDGNRIADLYLEDMLQSQNRMTAAELQYLTAAVGHSLSEALLGRAVGSLFESDVSSRSE
jgi:hypothetical protein